MPRSDRHPAQVLAAWGLEDAAWRELAGGHINRTWRLEHARGRFALQWLNPIFAPELHLDIAAVTARLAARGLLTPRLVPTRSGALWAVDGDGEVWRLWTWIEGRTLLAADGPARCAAAGRLLGAFHRALWDCDHRFHFGRLGVHDTQAHLAGLQQALADHAGHRLFDRVEALAAAIAAQAAGLELARGLPRRLVHGDPKIANILFGPHGRALCLVDLDTLARMPLPLELGDALRSWCNPAGEDRSAALRADYFAAALTGWAGAIGEGPTAAERQALVGCCEQIALELAARFCADALRESYFAWDRRRYGSAAEHNLDRAAAQLALARSIREQRRSLERIAARAWRQARD